MEEVKLLPFQNGKFMVLNVPHRIKKDEQSEPFIESDILIEVGNLLKRMEQSAILEADFKRTFNNSMKKEQFSDDEIKELRKKAKFELNRYPIYYKQLESGTDQERIDAHQKLELLEKLVEGVSSFRGKELIRLRFFAKCVHQQKDDYRVMKEMCLSRSIYYAEKADALTEVGGQLLVKGAAL